MKSFYCPEKCGFFQIDLISKRAHNEKVEKETFNGNKAGGRSENVSH